MCFQNLLLWSGRTAFPIAIATPAKQTRPISAMELTVPDPRKHPDKSRVDHRVRDVNGARRFLVKGLVGAGATGAGAFGYAGGALLPGVRPEAVAPMGGVWGRRSRP